MKLSLIVALTKAGVIGIDNRMPWHIPEDLKRFKSITIGHPIIMGRKTFESIGRVLPGRLNIVLTTAKDWHVEGAVAASSLAHAFEIAKTQGADEAFVIGGARVFEETLPLAYRLYLTYVLEEFSGDTFFPIEKVSATFQERLREDRLISKTGVNYQYVTLENTNYRDL